MQQPGGAWWFWFVVAALAVWRLTHLLHAEDGPFDALARLRAALGDGFIGKLLDCFYCLSMWTAVPAAWLIGRGWREWLLLWLALSAAAILVQRLIAFSMGREPAAVARIVYSEDPETPEEESDALLRKQSRRPEG